MKNKIKITCTGSRVISFESLRNFQGNLKSLEKPQFDKLKRSIEKHGFSFPVFVWGDNLILDGHQRLFVVGEMLKSGFSIDPVPVVDIEAKNEKEASEKLLILQGRYGKITEDGLYEFIHNFDLDIREIEKDLELPDIDLSKFMAGYFDQEESEGGDNGVVPDKDPNILVRLSFHPGVWLGKRFEIVEITEKLKKTYNCDVKIEE